MTINNINWKDFSNNLYLNLDNNHIFKIDIDDYFLDIKNTYKSIISAEELAKSLRYQNIADSKRYITSRHFLRTILSKFVGDSPENIHFELKNNKKPSVASIEFNVSHSNNMALVIISTNPVGIDLEFINQSFDYEPLLSNCFHPEEIRFLNTSNEKLFDFYMFWTRKEALLKSTGEGLIDELDQINCLQNSIVRNNLNYKLISYIINDKYVMSIAGTKKRQTDFWLFNHIFLK